MKTFKGLLVDLDGTIYFKGKSIKGAVDFQQNLKQRGIIVRYLTNTTALPPAKIIEKVRQYGLNIKEQELFNPITVAKAYFEQNGSLSYYIAASSEICELFLPERWDEIQPDYVVLGELRSICSYEELNKIFNFIDNGSRLMSTSYSPYFFASTGEKMMDTGALTRMFESSLNIKAMVIGKPAELFYQMALASTGLDGKDVIAIGDDIDTDVIGANRCGLYSVLVRTGKYQATSVQNSKTKPQEIISSLALANKFF